MTQHDALMNLSYCLDIFRENFDAHVSVALESIETGTDDEPEYIRMSCEAESLIQDFYELLDDFDAASQRFLRAFTASM